MEMHLHVFSKQDGLGTGVSIFMNGFSCFGLQRGLSLA